MKRVLISLAFIGALIIPVKAADVNPIFKAATYAPLQNSWSGFYIGANVAGAWDNLSNSSIPGIPNAKPSGFGGGLQVGGWYQFPTHNWVLGGVIDIDWLSSKDTITAFGTPVNVTGDIKGTARAKFGYSFGWVLPYMTGGIAGTKHDVSIPTFKTSQTTWGWVGGAGVEFKTPIPNVTVFAEYLYFGDTTGNFCIAGGCIPAKVNSSDVRVGLNVKL